ncbi:tetratricopeptide repeat protein [Dictyobacter alpinus]|uniref:Tetratricopeptide repeat protein n=1 Tax=Dictyobacter alpinus TaxID=2014873 RepID=A0A402BAK9_9CHLR|nr:FxSxx-COOH system tetratricopeptide repeat protein [Dictyobacter alpinus]GCE28327.1 tetratricopeptide repeat protein [Dictyobacter alpinus]
MMLKQKRHHAPNLKLRQAREARNWTQLEVADALGTTKLVVGRWERGERTPRRFYWTRLCELFGKTAVELGLQVEVTQATIPQDDAEVANLPIWNIPYSRNPFFTGRAEILQTLHERLNQDHTLALTQSWALSGLGGIGKTQVALEYAYQHRQDYRFVFWVSAATQESLRTGLVTIAETLQLPEKEERDQNRVIQAVKQWFVSHKGWLLILDNADDITAIYDVIPSGQPGHLLFTTRAQALGSLAQRIEIETMGMVEGTLFLLRRAKFLSSEASLDQVAEADLAAAEAIVIEMDFLPLALDQAGAYIEEVGCSLAAYLELYRVHRKELLGRRSHIPTDHPESVTTTLSLSFQKVEQANLIAANLLRLCAFLEPDAIPEELVSEGRDPAFSALNPLLLDEAIKELRIFSLLRRDAGTRTLRIHRLVQAVLKDGMEASEQQQWAERAIRMTNAIFPASVEATNWSHCLRYLSQAQNCAGLIQSYQVMLEEAPSLLLRTANYLQDHALYEQAEPLYQQALRIQEQSLEPNHSEIAQVCHFLSSLYSQKGQYEQAVPLCQRALQIREKCLGLDHPDVGASLNRLATLFAMQGKYEQAEPLFKQSIHTFEQALGSDHLELAIPIDGLAILWTTQKKYEQAGPLFHRALNIREQVLGTEHPDMAASLNNIASFYEEQNQDENAEVFFLRALHIWEQSLGVNHPYLAYPLNGLANIYRKQQKYPQADSFYLRALRIKENIRAQDSPDLAQLLCDLAALRQEQGNLMEAKSLYQRALTIKEQIFGMQHQETVATRADYFEVLQRME